MSRVLKGCFDILAPSLIGYSIYITGCFIGNCINTNKCKLPEECNNITHEIDKLLIICPPYMPF
jgi:hypothetical protein